MTRLRIATGDGYLIADAHSLMFLPDWSDVLATAFTGVPEAQRTRAVSSAAVEAGFELPPFVCVTWLGELYVMVFGDIQVETSAPSLPMLTGAGSQTWVERTVDLADVVDVAVEVRSSDLDDRLVLHSGVVPAGGFRLELRHEASDPVREPTGEPRHATGSLAPPEQPSSAVAVPDPPRAAEVAHNGRADETAASGLPQPDHADQPDHPGRTTSDDGLRPDDGVDDDVTLPPPTVSVGIEVPEGGTVRVEARPCPAGHLNPPSSTVCEICGERLDAGSAAIVHATRPSLGGIRLDDGTWHDLSDELLLGRNPSSDTSPERAAMTRVTTSGDKVSRVHVEVRLQAWDVLVGDCDSTNGTFVVPHSGGTVVQVEPGRLQIVEDGATVYFGSRSFQVVGRGAST